MDIEQMEVKECGMCGHEACSNKRCCCNPTGGFRFWTKTIVLCEKCHKKIVKLVKLKMEQIIGEYNEVEEWVK
jgi:hypothetical protein